MLIINLKHFPSIPLLRTFVHSPSRQTVSKACLKSMKAQNSFLLLFSAYLQRKSITNILSDVQ